LHALNQLVVGHLDAADAADQGFAVGGEAFGGLQIDPVVLDELDEAAGEIVHALVLAGGENRGDVLIAAFADAVGDDRRVQENLGGGNDARAFFHGRQKPLRHHGLEAVG